ncbi:MAG: SPASM domain-containing protein [Ardenticatenaceae bacterium]|nr:SPASM domain-containing protein [Anaerolineales bacterium]MCB8923344.1 SPASM domain-containing protein [Ardenticatenaceae bacterium]MCB9004656.1 SPASM domain-containing protein [Ardenticatenaceae bacterium]
MNTQRPILLTGQFNDRDDDCACPDKAFLLVFEQGESSEMDHDCACPDGAMGLTAVPTTPFIPHFTQTTAHTQPLPGDNHLAYSPYAPGGPSVLNQEAWQRWQQFATPQPLRDPIDHDLAAQNLLLPEDTAVTPKYTTPQTLTAWMHITNACNLECPYCYVRKSSARMAEATGRKAVQQIFATAQQYGFKRVKLKYAGGEATLHFKLVRQLHELAQALAKQTSLELREVILSNGVHLRPADADWLATEQVKLMISLDGIGAAHDRQRPMKGGGATFDHVAHTIDQILQPRGIRPDITITVTQQNAGDVAEAVRWVLARDLPVSLNFYRQNLLSANRADLALEEQAIIDGMLAAYAVFEEMLPERPFFNGLLDRVQAEAHAHTCGVQHSYLVVSHEGRLAQCQMHVNQPSEHMLDGDLLLPMALGPIQNLSVDQKECRDCEFRYRCTGGCPLETYRATGRWDVKSPHCNIYKTLLPAALRLEGLRLLKTNNLLPS